MKRIIFALAAAAIITPAMALARDGNNSGGLGDGGRDRDLSEYVLGRGEFDPNRRPTSRHENDVLPEDLIHEICEGGNVIIIYADDGSIEDWDCDFG